jgi:hypothetical protein
VAVGLVPLEAVAPDVGAGLGEGVPDGKGDGTPVWVASPGGVAIPVGVAGSVGVGRRTGAGVRGATGAGATVGLTRLTSIRKSNPEIVDTQNGEMETCATPYWAR